MTKQRQLVTTCPIFAMRCLKFTPTAAQNSGKFYFQSLRSLKHGASRCLSLQFSRCFMSVLGDLTGNSKARVIFVLAGDWQCGTFRDAFDWWIADIQSIGLHVCRLQWNLAFLSGKAWPGEALRRCISYNFKVSSVDFDNYETACDSGEKR